MSQEESSQFLNSKKNTTNSTKKPVIALVGYPNSGKTSLFNSLTSLKSKVVNYHGSTVEGKLAQIKNSHLYLFDTPGLRSLKPKTQDEFETLDCVNFVIESEDYELVKVILVIEASQILLQLPLYFQLKVVGLDVDLIISKSELLPRFNISYDFEALSKTLGCSIFLTFSKQKSKEQLDFFESLDFSSISQWSVLAPDYDIKRIVEKVHSIVTPLTHTLNSKNKAHDFDKIALHPFLGPLVFFVSMSLLFWSVFSLATPFIDAIDSGFSSLLALFSEILPRNYLTKFLLEGLFAGLGAVLVFVPPIFMLFFVIGILEASGYLSRGAVLIDRPLSALGLNGKSFVPLLSGCACAIPAMMAARTIPGRKERLLTMFIVPLMTCSARLPVYGLLLVLLLGSAHSFLAGLLMTGIYFLSFVFASIVAVVAGKFLNIKKEENFGFQIELPNWHLPNISYTIKQSLRQTLNFCRGAGPTIVVLSSVLWFLSSFPSPDASFLSYIGKFIEPLLKPMGVDWRVGVALLLAFAAREVFVSALVVIFSVTSGEDLINLASHLKIVTFEGTSQLIFTMPSILGLIIFFMLAMQCMSTIAVAKKEMAGWKLPLIMTGTYTVLAYVCAILVYQVARLVLS